jgi:hypothetical protein
MPQFIVNRNPQQAPGAAYEIHNMMARCNRLPAITDRVNLGDFDSSSGALEAALEFLPTAVGCHHCCSACNDSSLVAFLKEQGVWSKDGKTGVR